MKKHKCENCATGTQLERKSPWWATKRFHLLARHIHTGNVKTINQYDTELQAIQARDIYARMCNSHDTFVILDTQEAL